MNEKKKRLKNTNYCRETKFFDLKRKYIFMFFENLEWMKMIYLL